MSGTEFELAIVTGELAPDLSDAGRELAGLLAEAGVDAGPVLWNDPGVEWSTYDGVLVRSCWDYPNDVQRFRAMLDEIDRAGVPTCNPLPAIRWNLDKHYLEVLRDAGVGVPPTTVVDRGTDTTLEAVVRERGWEEVVVKPAVGAMSSGVWRTADPRGPAANRRFAEALAEKDLVVQEFVPEIADGERSVVLISGEYSHAWNSPVAGDDVTEFGDADPDYSPPAGIRERAADAYRAAREHLGLEPGDLPYARVDYVERSGDLVLMELELIEPYLGFERGPGSLERFRDAVVAYFGIGGPGSPPRTGTTR